MRVIAICSGCKVAVTLAADDPGIDRLALWSAESMGDLRRAAEAAWENGVLARFRALRRPVLFVFGGGSDPGAPGSRAAYERYCRTHGIPHHTHLIASAGHSYYGEAWTRELFEQTLALMS